LNSLAYMHFSVQNYKLIMILIFTEINSSPANFLLFSPFVIGQIL